MKTVCPPSNKESGEYGGLYGSDDDVDTTAWDLGAVRSGGLSDGDGSEEEEEEEEDEEEDDEESPPTTDRKVVPGDRGDDGDGHHLEVDFILDAIDNEADLSENCFGFGADADSDGSPDPGAQEGQRERNARLTGLLRMLSQTLEPAAAANMKKRTPESASPSVAAAAAATGQGGGRCASASATRRSHDLEVEGGAGGIHGDCSWARTPPRTFDVLLRVMQRPRGPADASPPSITELPGLLAAGIIISLALLAPILSTPRTGDSGRLDDGCRAGGAPAGTRRDGVRGSEQQRQLLAKACRHLFEVSKKAGADEAFYSSGAVTGLLEFIESAAADLGLTSGASYPTIRTQGQRPRRGRWVLEETAQCPRRDEDNLDTSSSRVTRSTGSGSSSGSSRSSAGCKRATREDDLLPGGEGVQSVCDSLTFAIGCLKNVSADATLQDRLVEAGSIRKLCRLIRSARDLCRRCDDDDDDDDEGSRKQQGAARPQQLQVDDDQDEKCPRRNNESGGRDPGGGVGVDGGVGGGEDGSDRVSRPRGRLEDRLRDRVAPLLAQAIGLLRDLAAGGKDRSKAFRAAGAVRTLCSVFPAFRGYQDVLLNTARALAKLSLQEKSRAEINSNPGHVRDLLAALVEQGREIDGSFRDLEEGCRDYPRYSSSTAARGCPAAAAAATAVVPVERRRHWEKQGKRIATCVRIAFALGNLTSASDDNRSLIGVRLGGAETLPALLLSSSRAHLAAWESLRFVENDHADVADRSVDGCNNNSSGGGGSSSSNNNNGGTRGGGQAAAPFVEECWSRRTLRRACDGLEEMLVKTVRLLANISIHREVGQRVCRHPGLAALEPLIGTCLELFGLFEDGALPHSNPCGQQGGLGGTGGRTKALMVPGEELLLNAVSLVTNLSFYGPELEDGCRRVAKAGLASPGSSVHEGSSSSSAAESPASAQVATRRRQHASILFALASKARREEVEDTSFGTGSGTGDNNPSSEGNVVGRHVSTATSHSCCPAGSSSSIDNTGAKNGGGGRGCGRRREVLCGHLVKVLLHPNAEAVAEAARAFGNFSRDGSCRQAMHQRRADEVLVALLGHRSREVVFAAAGALVNVAADEACKALLSRESVGAGERLARLVRRAGLADPSLAELACQALHNLLIEPLPPGGAEQALGGPDTCQKLWWTLKELMEACSCEGLGAEEGLRAGNAGAAVAGVGEQGGEGGRRGSRGLGGFPAAAAAVWGALNQGKIDSSAPTYDLVYEEL